MPMPMFTNQELTHTQTEYDRRMENGTEMEAKRTGKYRLYSLITVLRNMKMQ